jgi:hypothetical protein
MKQYKHCYLLLLLATLALGLQSCSSPGGDSNMAGFKTTSTGGSGQIGVNTSTQALFKGKIYFTLDRNLYVLDGTRTVRQLTHGVDVRDPVVSPDGKWVAFVIRYKDYADLAYMPASGGGWKVLRTGVGAYVPNPPFPAPKNTNHWFAQPAWASDSTHLLFLSDLQKADWDANQIGANAFLLDMQVFSLSINDPVQTDNQIVAYALTAMGATAIRAIDRGTPTR